MDSDFRKKEIEGNGPCVEALKPLLREFRIRVELHARFRVVRFT